MDFYSWNSGKQIPTTQNRIQGSTHMMTRNYSMKSLEIKIKK